MNAVFGPDGWRQEYFETADVDSVFSLNACLVFLDGSYDHIDSLQKFVNTGMVWLLCRQCCCLRRKSKRNILLAGERR